MKLEEIKRSEKAFLVPADIAEVLGTNPYSISLQARDCPAALGFPVCRIGSRTKIPRIPFIRFVEGGGADA